MNYIFCCSVAILACLLVKTNAQDPITSAVCSSCDFDEGVGYKGHSDCRKFIRCKQLPDNTYEVIVNDCPDGLFWQQKTKNCVHFPESDCYRNECDSDVPYRFHSVVCSAYFVCSNKRVTHECCPRDRPRFNPTTKTCEFSQTCEFQCEENLARNTGCQEPNKPFVDNNGRIDTCKYIVMVGTIEYEMSCPAGTRYNTSECRCLFSDSTFCIQDRAVDPCSPDLDLDFSNNQVTDRANNYSVSNFGPVIISGNSARFTGLQTQRIAIIRYSNVDFGLPLAIRVRYRDEVNRANMTILSTGGCISKPGVYITAGNGRVTIGIVTEELGYSQPFESSLNTQGANSWKDVTLWYDGKTLAGYLRDVATNSERAFPVISVSSTVNRIKMVEGSLQLGYAYNTNNPGFTGQIDMTRVWIGCTQITRPQDF